MYTWLWTDIRISKLDLPTRFVFVYLVTNHHNNLFGVYMLPKSTMAFECNLLFREIDSALTYLQQIGLIKYDDEKEVVFIKDLFKFHERKKIKKDDIDKYLEPLKESFIYDNFFEEYPKYKKLCIKKVIKNPEHDPVKLKEILSKIDLEPYRKEFSSQGLDVDETWRDFYNYVIYGTATDPTPNQKGWVNFKRAFYDSCRRSLDKGWHLLKTNKKEDEYYKEIIRESKSQKTVQEEIDDDILWDKIRQSEHYNDLLKQAEQEFRKNNFIIRNMSKERIDVLVQGRVLDLYKARFLHLQN